MVYAVILAGGVGSRMGGDKPKQYLTVKDKPCLLYTSPSPRDKRQSRMPSSA